MRSLLPAFLFFHRSCHACITDDDCNLNGVCISDSDSSERYCSCDAAWIGTDCGVLNVVENSARRIYPGPSTDDNISESNISSWGGLPVWDEETQMYHLFVSEFANACSLGQWSPNSQVIRATSKSLFGPYVKKEVVLEPFHHNPTITQASDGKSLFGPYIKQEVVLEPFHTNPTITQTSDVDGTKTWLLYVIGRDVGKDRLVNCTNSSSIESSHSQDLNADDPSPGNLESNISLFSSKSVQGPWAEVGVVLAGDSDSFSENWDADTTNPSAYALPDGSVHLMYRGCGVNCTGGEYIGLAVAPHWNCSVDVAEGCRYERLSNSKNGNHPGPGPLWRGPATAEDPFLYKDRRGHWHSLFHNLGRNGGFGCNNKTWQGCDVGGHAFSRDGIEWRVSRTIPFTTNITWAVDGPGVDGVTDGVTKAATLNRRERPQLVMDPIDKVTPIALVTGVQPGDVPDDCNHGNTVTSIPNACRSYTLAVAIHSEEGGEEEIISV